jgi:ABC-type transporter Mla subunit MlaD
MPGHTGQALPAGGTIPLAQSNETVDVDQVLSILQGPARRHVRQLLAGLAGALSRRGQRLSVLVGSAAGTLQNGSDVVDALYGQREQISMLVNQLGTVAAGLGERTSDIQNLARDGLTTFRALATRDDQLRALARTLPSTLGAIRTTTGKLTGATQVAAPVIANLAAAIGQARPAAQALAPAADELNAVVHGLGAASPPLRNVLAQLRAASGPAVSALPRLGRVLCQVNPMVRYAAPYVPDVVGLLTALSSASNAYEHDRPHNPARRHAERKLPGRIAAAAPTGGEHADPRRRAGQEQRAHLQPLSGAEPGKPPRQGLPPGRGPGSGASEAGYVYPRITADC